MRNTGISIPPYESYPFKGSFDEKRSAGNYRNGYQTHDTKTPAEAVFVWFIKSFRAFLL